MTRTTAVVCITLLWLGFTAPTLAESDSKPPLTVRDVVRMAIKAARHSGPGRAEQLARRARLAGLVPQLKLGARRGLQQDQSSTSTLSDDRVNASLGDDLTVEAGLTFQLDRLVFAPEEVRLLAVERWLAADRRKLVEDVVRLFFRRERLVQERDSAAADDTALDADIAELEALLDAYTENQFTAALAKLPPRTKRSAQAAGAPAASNVAAPAAERVKSEPEASVRTSQGAEAQTSASTSPAREFR